MSDSENLGRGAFGFVKLIQGDPPLAAKYVVREQGNPKYDKLFKKETEAMAKLDHPNIITYHGFDKVEILGMPWYEIRMEFCERNSLRTILEDSTIVYNLKMVFIWAEQLFSALCYLLDQKFVHRDIKPENILVTKSFTLKLGDFGCVRELNSISTVSFAGTYRYMSPEGFEGNRTIITVPMSDVYSTGLVLWELIERRQVFLEYGSSHDFNHVGFFADLKNEAFVLELAQCCHEIALLIDGCVDHNLLLRPRTTQVYQTLQLMNQNFSDDLMIETRHNQKHLLRPMGFDGSDNPIMVKNEKSKIENSERLDPEIRVNERPPKNASYDDTAYEVEIEHLLNFSKRQGADKRERIQRFFDSVAYLPSEKEYEAIKRPYLNFSPSEFFETYLPDDQDLRQELTPFLLTQVGFSNPYVLRIDVQPEFPKYEGFDEKIVEAIIRANVSEKSIKLLALYAKELTNTIGKTFFQLHAKYVDYFTGKFLKMADYEFDNWMKEHKNGLEDSSLYHALSKCSFGLEICEFRVPYGPSRIWCCLSEKDGLFVCANDMEKQVVVRSSEKIELSNSEGRTVIDPDVFQPKWWRTVEVNAELPFSFIDEAKKRRTEKGMVTVVEPFLRQSWRRKIEATKTHPPPKSIPYGNAYSDDDVFGFISYVFQLNVGPLEWQWIEHSELSKEQLSEYDMIHSEIRSRLLGEKSMKDKAFNLHLSRGPLYFYFLQKRSSIWNTEVELVLELPSDERTTVKCLNPMTGYLTEKVLHFDVHIHPCHFLKVSFEEIWNILIKNESWRSKQATLLTTVISIPESGFVEDERFDYNRLFHDKFFDDAFLSDLSEESRGGSGEGGERADEIWEVETCQYSESWVSGEWYDDEWI